MFFKMYGFDTLTKEKNENNPKSHDADTIYLKMINLEKHRAEELELDLNGNLLINGVTRYGKSVFAQSIAKQIEKRNHADIRVYFDIKKDYISRFYREGDKVVSFHDNLGPYNYFKWSLIKEVRNSDNPDFEIKEIVNMLLEDRLSGKDNDFFYKAAAKIFSGYVLSIVHTYKNNPSNQVLIHNLKVSTSNMIKDVLQRWFPNNYIVRDYMGDVKSKMTHSIMACLSELIDLFGGNFCEDGEDTIAEYLNGTYGTRLFLEYDYDRKASSNVFFRFFLNKIIRYKLSQNTDRAKKCILFLDEIAVLNGDFGLMDAVTMGAGNGLCLIVVTQSLEKLYCAAPQMNNTHITNASFAGFASFITFHPGDSETIDKMVNIFGEEEFTRMTLSLSRYQTPTCEVVRQNKVTSDKFVSQGVGEFYAKIKGNEVIHGRLVL